MIPFDFTNQVAVVTGASRGIGRSIAELLLRGNCSVIITSTQKMQPHWSCRYHRCTHFCADFLKPKSLSRFLKIIERLPRVDILVNNAGIHIPETLSLLKDAHWDAIMIVNLKAPMKLMKIVSLKMKSNKRGRILNVSSIAAIVSRPTAAAYSASKTGLIGLTRANALALAPFNVLVNSLCPGHVRTEMVRRLLSPKERKELKKKIPLRRFAESYEIANFAAFLVSDWNTYITGQTTVVDGGVVSG